MSVYAIIENSIVINIVEWDGVAEWTPESGEAVLIDGAVGIGWTYDGGVFTPPVDVEIIQEAQ